MCSAIRKAVLISLAIAAIASFQFVDGQASGGIHSIKGKIYLPNGRTLETTLRIELQSNAHPTKIVYTDSRGSFAFIGLDAGSYTVVVDAGDAFEVARETFFIDKEVQTSTFRITPIAKIMSAPIYLRPKYKQNDPLLNEVVNAKLASFPKSAVERYDRGLELAGDVKYDEARKEFRAALAIYPSFALAHIALGKIDIAQGKLDHAVASFKSALAIEPQSFDAHLYSGIALLNKRDMAGAEPEFMQAHAIDQNAVTPNYYLGIISLTKNDLDGAQKKFELARERAGTNGFPLLHRYLGGIYWKKGEATTTEAERKGLFRRAVEELEIYVKLSPTANDAKKIKSTINDLKAKVG
jgi:tetratricopeptide (TPR) repeat protein